MCNDFSLFPQMVRLMFAESYQPGSAPEANRRNTFDVFSVFLESVFTSDLINRKLNAK